MVILKEIPHCPDKSNIETLYDELVVVEEENNEDGNEEVEYDPSTDDNQEPDDDVETLTVTVVQEPLSRCSGRRNRRQAQQLAEVSERKGLGKKRARRQDNSRYLCQLTDSQDVESVPVLTSSCGSKFRLLFEDCEAFQAWNDFNKISEESQCKFLWERKEANQKRKRKHKRVKTDKENLDVEATKYFDKLTSKQKIVLEKTNFPLGILKHLEDKISDFFCTNPRESYTSEPLSGFERLIAHGIAAYHCLESISIDSEVSENRCVQIVSCEANYKPPAVSLSDFLTGPQHPKG